MLVNVERCGEMSSPPIADSDGFMYTFYCDLEKVMMIT